VRRQKKDASLTVTASSTDYSLSEIPSDLISNLHDAMETMKLFPEFTSQAPST
jgi:hypothetical protein